MAKNENKEAPHTERPVRHILSVSGGKDSSALAIYMSDRDEWRRRLGKPTMEPAKAVEMEYVFCDTKEELPETYEYLDKLEAFLRKPIERLCDDRGFKHWLEVYQGFLPGPNVRWCTRMLKLKPFEDYIGDDFVYSYIGIRADEERDSSLLKKPNISVVYPFKEDGITRDDVIRILNESGASLPKYYEWRTRSGCYFCFFQRKSEWVGLKENHPDLFEKAKKFEAYSNEIGGSYTWSQGESLEAMSSPERITQIKANHIKAIKQKRKALPNRPLVEVLNEVLDDEDDEQGCAICHL
jgi:3'-phosphoadenosine 5'-phosphosulfate sulfotransferase (PAPS reductase)/FAD synthetase